MLRQALAIVCAIAALGAANAAPPDPRPDPDACTLLQAMDLEPLLLAGTGGVIDGYNYYPAPGLVTCRWLAQPRNHAADAVRRTATLAFYHIADAARAQAQLDRQPHHDTRPSLAITGQGDDAIVRPSPTTVMARHGADIAVIDGAGAEMDNPDQLEARYLLDALALKAAGAKVRNPPWVAPDHVARMVPLAATGSIGGWTPPPRLVPTEAVVLEPAIHLLKRLAAWGSGLMVVLLPVAMVLFFIPWPRRKRGGIVYAGVPVIGAAPGGSRWPPRIGAALIAMLVLDMLFAGDAANALIDHYGQTGAGLVTGSFATATQYNHRDVIGFRVLIGTADRRAVQAEFRTDDFIVRGLGDSSITPGPGDVFTVRYLAAHPEDFIIRNDDQSPWARKLACARLAAWRGEAARRAGAVPNDIGLRRELARAMMVDQQAGCAG